VLVGIALATVTAEAAEPRFLHGGIGNRNVSPTGLEPHSYRVVIGRLTVDLRGYGGFHVKASVGIGQIIVYAPAQQTVAVHSHVGVGQTEVFGTTRSGVGADLDYTAMGESSPLVLDVEAGIGQVRVVRG
jgi:hypothetical protein